MHPFVLSNDPRQREQNNIALLTAFGFALTGEDGSLTSGLKALPVEEATSSGAVSGPVRDTSERIARLFTGGSTGRPRMWDKTVGNLVGEAAFLAQGGYGEILRGYQAADALPA